MFQDCPYCAKLGTTVCGNDPDCLCFTYNDNDDCEDYDEDGLAE